MPQPATRRRFTNNRDVQDESTGLSVSGEESPAGVSKTGHHGAHGRDRQDNENELRVSASRSRCRSSVGLTRAGRCRGSFVGPMEFSDSGRGETCQRDARGAADAAGEDGDGGRKEAGCGWIGADVGGEGGGRAECRAAELVACGTRGRDRLRPGAAWRVHGPIGFAGLSLRTRTRHPRVHLGQGRASALVGVWRA